MSQAIKNAALAVLNYLKGKKNWTPTINILHGIGWHDNTNTRNKLRDILHKLADNGVLRRTGDKKFMWHLESTTVVDPSNPFKGQFGSDLPGGGLFISGKEDIAPERRQQSSDDIAPDDDVVEDIIELQIGTPPPSGMLPIKPPVSTPPSTSNDAHKDARIKATRGSCQGSGGSRGGEHQSHRCSHHCHRRTQEGSQRHEDHRDRSEG